MACDCAQCRENAYEKLINDLQLSYSEYKRENTPESIKLRLWRMGIRNLEEIRQRYRSFKEEIGISPTLLVESAVVPQFMGVPLRDLERLDYLEKGRKMATSDFIEEVKRVETAMGKVLYYLYLVNGKYKVIAASENDLLDYDDSKFYDKKGYETEQDAMLAYKINEGEAMTARERARLLELLEK